MTLARASIASLALSMLAACATGSGAATEGGTPGGSERRVGTPTEHDTLIVDAATRYAIIPRPSVITPATGTFTLTRGTTVHADAAFLGVAQRFTRDVARPMGFTLGIRRASAGTPGRTSSSPSGIRLVRDAGLPAEGYSLDVTPSGVVVRASTPAGAFYALESFKQLLPAPVFAAARVEDVRWTAPAVHIEDAPRFTWRGAHLDAARHFMPKEFVKKYIDLLARHKMNRFHWHLTDDQGWRIEIRKYPRLTEMGSCREQTMVPPYRTEPKNRVFDGKRHCGFYTQQDIREVVAYAADRFITVVPEIEMPGHAQAAIYAYPALSSKPDSTPTPGVMQVWGVSEFIFNPDSATIAFLQDVLSETLALFPSQFIHVGGDEAVKPQWKSNPRIQGRIRELGLKDEHELQSWFIRQMDQFLTKRGRRLVGWDEILEGGLAENATVMSWRGTAGGIAAAKAGHDVIMASNGYLYFDYYQSPNKAAEPYANGGVISLDSVYAFEPVPAALTADESRHVLGAQAQLWTEYIPSTTHAEYMAYPRLVALSEVVWTRKELRDLANFKSRLPAHLRRLDAIGVNYRPLDR